MRFASLGSGSEGNALMISVNQTQVLMDCGFGLKDTILRLERLGISPAQLSGIIVTHEHGDHISGVARLASKFGLPVWLTHGTLNSQPKAFSKIADICEIAPQQVFSIGDIEITPYPVPHDAAEPVQYVFSDGMWKLGVLTDAGCGTPHIEEMLSGCHALVLECNHDNDMLMHGDYPYSLKQRIGGRYGHLSNQEAAEILSRLEIDKLQHLVAAHLSRKNNTPKLAVQALCEAIGCEESWIGIATQEEGFSWRSISA